MGLINRKKDAGYFCLIDWCESAVKNAVGGEHLKVIYHTNNGTIIGKESYSLIKIHNYLRNKISIIDLTVGQQVPAKAILIPQTQQFLGAIQLHGRMNS